MQKLRSVAIASMVSVMLMSAGAAHASVRPAAVHFGEAAPLKAGNRKSEAVAPDNSFRMSIGTTALIAAVLAGLGVAFLIDDDKDEPVSPS